MLLRYLKERNCVCYQYKYKMLVDIYWNKQQQQDVHVDVLCTINHV